MAEYRLEMRDVCKSFPGVKALDHAQLKLKPGTVHALMGENGAGKSTLMKCMFGIYKMDEGEIYYEGEKKVHIKDPLDALKRGIAMVHQELQPIPERSVAENIFVGRYPMRSILVDHEKMYEKGGPGPEGGPFELRPPGQAEDSIRVANAAGGNRQGSFRRL